MASSAGSALIPTIFSDVKILLDEFPHLAGNKRERSESTKATSNDGRASSEETLGKVSSS